MTESIAAQYSLSRMRSKILTTWDAPWEMISVDRQRDFDALWQELRNVEQADAWSSVVLQCGRILEFALGLKYVAPGVPARPIRKPTLSALLKNAYALGAVLGSKKSGASPVAGDTLRRLRNLAAHYDELSTPSELHATQAILILLVFIEAVAGDRALPFSFEKILDGVDADDEDWLLRNWQFLSPNFLLRSVLDGSDEFVTCLLSEGTQEVFDKLLQATSGRSLARLPWRMRRLGSYSVELAVALDRHLVWILARLSLGSSANWGFFLKESFALGFKSYYDALMVLIPYDSEWILNRFRGGASVNNTAWTVRTLRKNNRTQWRELCQRQEDADELGKLCWQQDSIPWKIANNTFLLATFLPTRPRLAIIKSAPVSAVIENVARATQLPRALNIARLYIVNTRDRAVRDAVWASVCKRIESSSMHEVRNVPMVLVSARATDGVFGREVLRMLVEKDPAVSEREEAAYLLFAVWLSLPNLRRQIGVRCAELAMAGTDWPSWMFWGLAILCDYPVRILSAARTDLDRALVSMEVSDRSDRDSIGLAVIGIIGLASHARGAARLLAEIGENRAPDRPRDLPGYEIFYLRLARILGSLKN
jgi:hypothetical protein